MSTDNRDQIINSTKLDLEHLSDLMKYIEAKKAELEERVESFLCGILTAHQQEHLASIKQEYTELIEDAVERSSVCEKHIKETVAQLKESVKGTNLHAVYVSPRVTWDSKLLEGLMIAIPELNTARKVGNPSVRINKVKE